MMDFSPIESFIGRNVAEPLIRKFWSHLQQLPQNAISEEIAAIISKYRSRNYTDDEFENDFSLSITLGQTWDFETGSEPDVSKFDRYRYVYFQGLVQQATTTLQNNFDQWKFRLDSRNREVFENELSSLLFTIENLENELHNSPFIRYLSPIRESLASFKSDVENLKANAEKHSKEKLNFFDFFYNIFNTNEGFEKFVLEDFRNRRRINVLEFREDTDFPTDSIISFKTYFSDRISSINDKLNRWLSTLYANEKRIEVEDLVRQLDYYIDVCKQYELVQVYAEEVPYKLEDGTEATYPEFMKQTSYLNDRFPSVQQLLESLKKDLIAKHIGLSSYSESVNDISDQTSVSKAVVDSSKNTDNRFNSMPIQMVNNNFIELTEKKSKNNNNPHLTPEQFEEFITTAFLQYDAQSPPTSKLKLNYAKEGETQTIIRIFYQFYKNSKQEYESTQHQKNKYVRLLTDYFEGFDYEKVKNNFNK